MTISVKDSAGSNQTVKTIDDLAADGGQITFGAKADAKNSATDATAITAMSVWKQISFSIQAAAASLAGTLTVATHGITAAASAFADGALVTLGSKTDAKATQTDTTSVSAMSVWKQISASVQALATAIGSAVITRGAGAADANTLRVTMDTGQFQTPGQLTQANSTSVCPASDSASFPTVPLPRAAANGATSTRITAAATTNAAFLKASAGNLVNVDLFNMAAYDVFVKFYNKGSAPTVGTDTPVWTVPIKAGTGFSRDFTRGKSFATGIAYAITKLQADSDTTAVAAGDVVGSIDWI